MTARPKAIAAQQRGNVVAERQFTAIYRRGGQAVGCLAVNQPGPFIAWRKRLAGRPAWDEAI